MYQALYRKYRPQTFDDVAGQQAVTRTLKAQLLSGKLSHAYIAHGASERVRRSKPYGGAAPHIGVMTVRLRTHARARENLPSRGAGERVGCVTVVALNRNAAAEHGRVVRIHLFAVGVQRVRSVA